MKRTKHSIFDRLQTLIPTALDKYPHWRDGYETCDRLLILAILSGCGQAELPQRAGIMVGELHYRLRRIARTLSRLANVKFRIPTSYGA